MEVRDRILQKADEICRKVGFRAMTLDGIASELSISKKTIYQYFETKDELVDAVIEIEMEICKDDCRRSVDVSQNAIEEILIFLEAMTQDMKETNPIVVHDLKKFYPRSYCRIDELRNDFFYSIISENLIRGIEEGFYNKNINIDVITKIRLATMILPFDQEVFPSSKYDYLKVTETLTEHFLQGILSDKGRTFITNYKIKKSTYQNA